MANANATDVWYFCTGANAIFAPVSRTRGKHFGSGLRVLALDANELLLSGPGEFDNSGIVTFGSALSFMYRLVSLDLSQNRVDNVVCVELAKALPQLGVLEELLLQQEEAAMTVCKAAWTKACEFSFLAAVLKVLKCVPLVE